MTITQNNQNNELSADDNFTDNVEIFDGLFEVTKGELKVATVKILKQIINSSMANANMVNSGYLLDTYFLSANGSYTIPPKTKKLIIFASGGGGGGGAGGTRNPIGNTGYDTTITGAGINIRAKGGRGGLKGSVSSRGLAYQSGDLVNGGIVIRGGGAGGGMEGKQEAGGGDDDGIGGLSGNLVKTTITEDNLERQQLTIVVGRGGSGGYHSSCGGAAGEHGYVEIYAYS